MPSQTSKLNSRDLPQPWFSGVEKAKEKAQKLVRQLIAVDQNTSIVVGELEAVEIDKLWKLQYPYCKLTLSNPIRFRIDGRMDHKMGETEIFFVNKPEMVLHMSELQQRNPKIHEEAHFRIKQGKW